MERNNRITTQLRVLFLGACLVLACRGDGVPTTGANPPPTAPGANNSAALPANQQCLPAMICDEWAGCALVEKNPQGHWTVVVAEADRLRPAQVVSVENACTDGNNCQAAKAVPPGVTCAPHTIPPVIKKPDYACVWEKAICRMTKAAH